MRKRNRKRNTGSMLVLVLFAVFAMCVLSVLLTGADSYQRVTGRDQASYDRRTAAQYITTKIRQSDASNMLFVGDFENGLPDTQGNTLYLTEMVDEAVYCTRLYCYDGCIRELFSTSEGVFSFEDGEKVLPAQSVYLSMKDGFVSVELTHPDGETEHFVLALRSTGVTA